MTKEAIGRPAKRASERASERDALTVAAVALVKVIWVRRCQELLSWCCIAGRDAATAAADAAYVNIAVTVAATAVAVAVATTAAAAVAAAAAAAVATLHHDNDFRHED